MSFTMQLKHLLDVDDKIIVVHPLFLSDIFSPRALKHTVAIERTARAISEVTRTSSASCTLIGIRMAGDVS